MYVYIYIYDMYITYTCNPPKSRSLVPGLAARWDADCGGVGEAVHQDVELLQEAQDLEDPQDPARERFARDPGATERLAEYY